MDTNNTSVVVSVRLKPEGAAMVTARVSVVGWIAVLAYIGLCGMMFLMR